MCCPQVKRTPQEGHEISQQMAFRRPERVQVLVITDGTCITWKHSTMELFLARVSPYIVALFLYETLKRSGLKNRSLMKEVSDYTYEAFSRLSKQDLLTILKAVSSCLHYEQGYRISQPMLLKLVGKWAG